MRRFLLYFVFLTISLGASAQHPKTAVQAYVDQIARQEPLRSSVWGVLAVNAKGDTLAARNAFTRMVPASNTKLVTTGVALHRLGGDFRFETTLAHSGRIEGGVLKGDLYIVGGGDPTTAAPDSIATSAFTLFSHWKNILLRAGIKRIEGRIIGDGRYFDGAHAHPSWGWDDLGTDYGTGGNGLCFYENQKEFAVTAGKAIGDPVSIREGYPSTPWMKYHYYGTTAKAGTGDELYLYTSPLAPVGEVRGTFAINRGPRTEHFSNKYGALTCAFHFYQYLVKSGIHATLGPADIEGHGLIRPGFDEAPAEKAVAQDSLTRLGSTFSPSLARICRETNYRSDNFYAETLLRTLGRREKGTCNYDSCLVVERGILEELGVDCHRGFHLKDGSGLSRQNTLSPEFLVRFLRAMRRSPAWDSYLASLPRPGSNGTMRQVLPALPQETKDRIRLKSGSMEGVLCYSGYILPKEGGNDIIYFSIMTGNADVPAGKVRPVITQIIAKLAE